MKTCRTSDSGEPLTVNLHIPPHAYLAIIVRTDGESRRREGWMPGAGRAEAEPAIANSERLDFIVNGALSTFDSDHGSLHFE